MLQSLGTAYADAGRHDQVMKIYNELHEISKVRYVSPYTLGSIAISANKLDEAFLYFDEALIQKNKGFNTWKHSIPNKLKSRSAFVKDPRYKKIMDRPQLSTSYQSPPDPLMCITIMIVILL